MQGYFSSPLQICAYTKHIHIRLRVEEEVIWFYGIVQSRGSEVQNLEGYQYFGCGWARIRLREGGIL